MLTELTSFGPIGMAGDAFSVSDELVSLLVSPSMVLVNTNAAAGRFDRVLSVTRSSSAVGILENRCACV